MLRINILLVTKNSTPAFDLLSDRLPRGVVFADTLKSLCHGTGIKMVVRCQAV